MRLATFLSPAGGEPLAGEVRGQEAVSFDDGTTVIDRIASGDRSPATGATYALDRVRLLQPHAPRGIFAVALNYPLHADEAGLEAPPRPKIFYKGPGSATGPSGPVVHPAGTNMLDYEIELALVIGADRRVAGYCVANDVSARDWQRGDGQWWRAKGADTFCPFGPWITTKDELADPYRLRLRTWVNGALRQDANTKDMIFKEDALLEFIASGVALNAGDLILTGTPDGVGVLMKPEQLLAPGDVVRMEIDELGAIEHEIV